MRQEKDNIKDGGAAYSERTLPHRLYGKMAALCGPAIQYEENALEWTAGFLCTAYRNKIPRCSNRILNPMRMRMEPPASSALDL